MYTDEQLELKALAHDFAVSELRPHTARWDEQRALDDDIFDKLAELGFFGMLVPEEHGGLGFDATTYLLVLEELAWGDVAVALTAALHNVIAGGLIAAHGTDEQKAEWLPTMAAGEALGAFALTEPDSGSDPSSISTRAVRDGDGWALTGRKRWVTNGGRARLIVTYARTDEGITAFLVRSPAGGLSLGPLEKTMGVRALDTVGAELDGVRASDGDVLGDVGAGLRYGLGALDLGRLGVAVQSIGIGRAALGHATEYALGREQFDQPIARFGAIQAKLAEMARRIAAGRALVYEAAALLGPSGNGGGADRTGLDGLTARVAMAKLTATQAATWAADEAVQIYGGYGYMRHYPVEKLLRDAKGAEIYEGTNEIMRMVIAREILRDAGD